MIKKILFPTDFSENSKRAQEHVINIARTFNAEVLILHCFDMPSYIHGEIAEKLRSGEIEDNYVKYNMELLAELKKDFTALGINCSILVQKASPGPEILAICEAEGFDTIIMGRRGLNSIQTLLMGSVSNYVLHHTDRSVIIIQ